MSAASTPGPLSIEELVLRAASLEGRSLDDVAEAIGAATPEGGLHQKGKIGELCERALGASGGSFARVDFPSLGVELKTIPVGPDGRPRESTFVCAIRLDDAETAEWESSWVRRKLARVLFLPVVGAGEGGARRFGRARLWSPTAEQDGRLRDDFDEVMGLVGIGRVEDVTAHLGRYLQVRPKARDGSARTVAFGADGERIATVPRSFYLRSLFTGAILLDPRALP